MKLTSKSEYAILAMLELALHDGDRPLPLIDIAVRHRVSPSYLELLFARLRRAGLLHSRRGPRGGFALARSADRISVGEIVALIDDQKDRSARDGVTAANPTTRLWRGLSSEIQGFLEGLSLGDLVVAAAGAQADTTSGGVGMDRGARASRGLNS
jgi:Rrf2 family iron-sulfur cluster assembly transcriptional regulator